MPKTSNAVLQSQPCQLIMYFMHLVAPWSMFGSIGLSVREKRIKMDDQGGRSGKSPWKRIIIYQLYWINGPDRDNYD